MMSMACRRIASAWSAPTLRITALAALLSLAGTLPADLHAQDLPTVADHTAGMRAVEGFFDIFWDESEG